MQKRCVSYGRHPRNFRKRGRTNFSKLRVAFLLLLFALALYGFNTYFYLTSHAQHEILGNSAFQSDMFKNDILPIELSNSKLKGYQRVQLSWAKDGTIVQRLGKKKLFGEIIGVPFRCPRFYLGKKQRLSHSALVYCVQVFFRSNSRFVTEPLGNYKLITASNIQIHRRTKLAKFWKLSKRLDSLIIRSLFDTYRNRPLLMTLDENAIHLGGERNSSYTLAPIAKTGYQIHCEICSIVKILSKVYLIPRDGKKNTLMVNYGPQKSEIHYSLYLASVAGNFNMLMLNNYLPLAETLERIVYEKNKDIQRLVLFVPSYVEEEVCKMSKKFLNNDLQPDAVQDRRTMLQQILLISITDGVKIKCPSKMLETEELENKIQYTTYFSMINQCKEWKCDQKPLRTSSFPVAGRHYIARSNAKNEAELVEYAYKFTAKYNREKIYYNLRHRPNLPMSVMVSTPTFPMSSGDTTVVFENLAYGAIQVLHPLNFARYDIFSMLTQPEGFGGSPVQLPHVKEEFLLKQHFFENYDDTYKRGDHGKEIYKMLWTKRLEMCYTGGGFPNPSTERFLEETGHCPNGVEEGWGSYENWDIGFGDNNVYKFIGSNVLDWDLISFGPYKADNGEGELVLRTKAMNQHDEKRYNTKRYFMLDGAKFFHTRDIIRVIAGNVGEVADAKISMIDKTTCPFQLENGRWIRTGLVERAIEGEQTIFSNCAIFGSRNSNDIVAVVWLTNVANLQYKDDDTKNTALLTYMRDALKDQVYDYEIPKYIIKSDEPWEYRPRAKIRRVLQLKFGDLVNSIIPGTIPSQFSGNVNLAVARNTLLTKRIKDELQLLFHGQNGDGPISTCEDENAFNICNVLLGCFDDREGDSSCMVRTKSGMLREPSIRQTPYDPENMPLSKRLSRYDNEPWHYWDLQENNQKHQHDNLSREKFMKSLLILKKYKQRIGKVLPLILPSLGLLVPFGLRLRMRLDCLIRIASLQPKLLSYQKMTKSIYINVMRICRFEWFDIRSKQID
eukprot:g15245.t1